MDTLNTIDLKTTYGLVILTGTEKLLEYPERKDTLQVDFLDHNGTDYYLDTIYFKDKEVTLNCAIMAVDDVQFWAFYDAFFAAIATTGKQDLFIYDHGKTYQVFYKRTGNFKKSLKRLKNVSKVFVKFDLILQATL